MADGLSPAEQTRFAHKLVDADLAAERARARALAAEARGEGGTRAGKLQAIARDRLALIATEAREREALAGALEDGSSAAAYVASLQTMTPAQLRGQPTTGARGLAVRRERERRQARTEAAQLAREAERLKRVKAEFSAYLAADPAYARPEEQRLEAVRLDAAKAAVGAANARLARAHTPAERARARADVKAAEQAVRTEYARDAVVNVQAPPVLDRWELMAYALVLQGVEPGLLAIERERVAAELKAATTGAVRGKPEAVAWARTRLAIADAALARVAPVAPVVPVERPRDHRGPAVWRQPGVFVWHPDAFPAEVAIAKLKAQGVKWVALQIADGTTVNPETTKHLDAGYIAKLHAAGIQVGFWGVNRTQPEDEARVAAEQLKKYGADFYIADAEIEYKYTSASGAPDADAYGRSKRFIQAFRAAEPDIPAALSSYGRTDLADIDWKAWQDAGFDWLPQAYLNEFPIYDPALCVEAAVKSGWPRDRVHPTLGLWGGGQDRLVGADEYVALLRKGGAPGFSSYLAEQMSDADWAGLGKAIAEGGLAE